MTTPVTARDRAKAERTDAILLAAAELFGARGYSGVSLEDIGAAVAAMEDGGVIKPVLTFA